MGDDCGPCSNPSLNFDCGECDSSQGLKCLAPEVMSFDISPKCNFPLLPIASARIQGTTGTRPIKFLLYHYLCQSIFRHSIKSFRKHSS